VVECEGQQGGAVASFVKDAQQPEAVSSGERAVDQRRMCARSRRPVVWSLAGPHRLRHWKSRVVLGRKFGEVAYDARLFDVDIGSVHRVGEKDRAADSSHVPALR